MKDFLGDLDEEENSSVPDDDASDNEGKKLQETSLNLDDEGFVLPQDGILEDAAEEENAEEADGVKAPEEGKTEETGDEKRKTVIGSLLDNMEYDSGSADENEVEHRVLSMEELDDVKGSLPLADAAEQESAEDIAAGGIIYDIYRALGASSVFASFVRDSDEETLEELEDVVRSCWSKTRSEQKDKLFNIPDYSFSILLSRDRVRDDLRMSELLNNAGGVMYSRGKDEWTAVILYIDDDFIMQEAMEKTINRASFNAADWKRVTFIGEQMRKR